MEETNNSTSTELPHEDNNNLHKIEPETETETDLHSQVHHHDDIFSPTNILLIILPIVIIILLISILIIILILRRIKSSKTDTTKADSTRNTKADSTRNSNGDCMFLSHSIVSINASPDVNGRCLYGANSVRNPTVKVRGVQVFTFKELEVATDRFSDANVIGNGGFGVVYKGVLKDGTIAAIKRLHREGKQGERAFRIEVDLLSRLNCTYMVQLHGYCADQHHRLLIFEFMPNGSLYGHLHSSISQYRSSLNWGIRLLIALDCARGLEYLHEHTVPSVIHRDFKSSNILLNQHFRAKVSDFGLAKTGSDKINGLVSTRVLGTTGYLAPEYASTGKLTTKSDVYSYGVVLLELITGRVPVDTNRPPGEHVLVSWALPRLTNREKVMGMVDPSLQGQYSRKDLIQVAAIAAMCVQGEADYRPLMTDVVQSLIPLAKNHSTSCSSNSGRFSQNASPKC